MLILYGLITCTNTLNLS